MRTILALALTVWLLSQPVVADQVAALRKAGSAIGNDVSDVVLSGPGGKAAPLRQFAGKPLIIAMVYTGCTDVCPTLIDSLQAAVDTARESLGADSFNVITVGFDTRHDTPERMASLARQHGVRLDNWRFLAGDVDNITRLAEATGFSFTPSAGGFEHSGLVSIVDGDGKVYSQVFGATFEPPVIVEPLKDAILGAPGPILSLDGVIDRVRFYCTVYNPNTGRYYFNYSLFIGIAIGLACLATIAGWLTREFLRSGQSRSGTGS